SRKRVTRGHAPTPCHAPYQSGGAQRQVITDASALDAVAHEVRALHVVRHVWSVLVQWDHVVKHWRVRVRHGHVAVHLAAAELAGPVVALEDLPPSDDGHTRVLLPGPPPQLAFATLALPRAVTALGLVAHERGAASLALAGVPAP